MAFQMTKDNEAAMNSHEKGDVALQDFSHGSHGSTRIYIRAYPCYPWQRPPKPACPVGRSPKGGLWTPKELESFIFS